MSNEAFQLTVENIKKNFCECQTLCYRPCAMCVPDFELICEIMLVAEGFQEARVLARKFITLYTLCKELLSKQDHYDWGLRAIKSVLVVAGSLKVNIDDNVLHSPNSQLMYVLSYFNDFRHNSFISLSPVLTFSHLGIHFISLVKLVFLNFFQVKFIKK